ncbi:MAG: hypothetical protein E6X49_19225 [Leclercia adecarboxylata]|nr:hypothetical protein [uncultured Leclercia sp.]MDU4843252.1 hypothetical protein [Leclercia adecarboxylata]
MATLDDDLANAVTEGFRLAQSSIINQDLILSGTGDVTVTLANGSKKTGPSWSKLITAANAAGTSATAAKTSETNALASKNAAATSATNAATSEGNALASKNAAKTSETNAKTSETNAKTSENNAGASASSAAASLAAAQQLTSVPYEEAPFPDVWAPLNDDLRLLAGFAPYDRLTISGQVLELPSKSVTFTRATAATYIDKSGVLRIAAINEPRFEKEGLLMEGWGTNHILYSADTTKWRSSFAEDVGIAQSEVLAPDGASLAGRVSFLTTTAVQATISANIENYSGFTTGGFVTTSFFVKPGERSIVQIVWPGGATGVSSAYANFDLASMTMKGNCLSYDMQRIAGGWVRCTATALVDGDMSAAGTIGAWIGIINSLNDGRRPQVSGVVGEGFYVWGAQMEAQRIATSYIPTAGISATRLGETATLSADCNAGYATAGDLIERTTAIEFSSDRLGLAAGSTVTALQVAGITNDLMLRFSATELLSYRGSSVIRMPVTHPISRGVFVQTIDKNNLLNMHFGGKKVGNQSIPTNPSQKPTTINITSVTTCSYHIRNIRIWHRVLNENQIKGIR